MAEDMLLFMPQKILSLLGLLGQNTVGDCWEKKIVLVRVDMA